MRQATDEWLRSIGDVYDNGHTHTPRNMKTKEILNQTIEFDMNYPICQHDVRKLSYKFMAAEAYWITSGSMFTEDIAPYNKHIAEYSDDGHIFNGAYGPAFLNQLNYVVKTLEGDRGSRQACMTIWHPNPQSTRDYKCTIALIFNIRANHIYTTVLMRSNDLILGRPYDIFNFTMMTLKVLTEINKNLGTNPILLGHMTLHTASAHYYERDFDLVQEMMAGYQKWKTTEPVPYRALHDWKFVVECLLACRDMRIPKENNAWNIRP